MKIQIPKSKDFTQSREGAKSIAKKTFAYSLRPFGVAQDMLCVRF